jgi:predicted dehydrogenase
MIEQTTHTFDLVRYLGGEAAEVFAYAATGFNTGIPDYSIEDATAVNVHLQNGGVAVLLSCCAANGGGGGVWLSVFAKNTTFLFNGWEHSVQVLQSGKVATEIPGEPDIFTIEDRAFLKAVRTGDKSSVLCSYPDAARTLALTLAADQSLRTGKPVAPEAI